MFPADIAQLLSLFELKASSVLHSLDSHRLYLAAIKGLRNGLIYGVKIRAPHAFVMTFLFQTGTFWEKIIKIFNLTKQHAMNLAKFVFMYKGGRAVLETFFGKGKSWQSFLSAFLGGYFIFGANNNINMQINLYLLSRVLLALSKLAIKQDIIQEPQSPVFPYFGAIIWGLVLWLFEMHPELLQKSLFSSMEYLYHDSDKWTGFMNFFVKNE